MAELPAITPVALARRVRAIHAEPAARGRRRGRRGGFQGLSTAIALRRTAPALRVAVLEHELVGYGTSGRNGSFAISVVGLGFGVMARPKGHAFVRDAHRYMP